MSKLSAMLIQRSLALLTARIESSAMADVSEGQLDCDVPTSLIANGESSMMSNRKKAGDIAICNSQTEHNVDETASKVTNRERRFEHIAE